MLPDNSGSLTILPISDPVVKQGDVLRISIPIRRKGPERGSVTYSLGDAPPGATIDETTGDLSWPTAETDKPGTYPVIVKVLTAERRPLSDERKFAVVLLKKSPQRPARQPKRNSIPACPPWERS